MPRGDFLDQLLKWSIIEFEENGRRGYGMKMVCDICEEYLNVRPRPLRRRDPSHRPPLSAAPAVGGRARTLVMCASPARQ